MTGCSRLVDSPRGSRSHSRDEERSADLKTNKPLILTARVAEVDLQPFDLLRETHFPPERNFLRAHLTMFHRLPGEYVERITGSLQSVADHQSPFTAKVTGVRHLGMGVGFSIESPELISIRDELRKVFINWLGSQDMRTWQPHITIQNKVAPARADKLYRELSEGFQMHGISITGLDLWRYLDGPWASEWATMFDARQQAS